MRKVADLHVPWPSSFLQEMKSSKTTYSDIAQPRTKLPFWLADIANNLKHHQHPTRDEAEVSGIAQLGLNRDGFLSSHSLRSNFGVNIRRERLPSSFRSSVSPDNHEALMVSLEQAASFSFDIKTRIAYLQDQVMFSLYRFTDLSTAKICALQLADLMELPVSSSNEDLWLGPPQSRVEAIKALHRYVGTIRCHLDDHGDCPYTFLSAHTRKHLHASGVQARFRRATVGALLTAPIPRLTAYKLE